MAVDQFFSLGAIVCLGLLLIHEDFCGFYITHSDAPQSVRLLTTSDQLVAETSTLQHATLTTDRYPCPPWDSKPRSQQASGRRPMPETARPLGPAAIDRRQ
jgi:hypothetical protein